MPKYIDVENIRLTAVGTVDEDGDILVSVRDVKRAIDQTPAVDVVPRTEIETIFDETMQAIEKGIAEANEATSNKTQIEDIKSLLICTGQIYAGYIGKSICQVFKKHTGGLNDGREQN